MFRWKTTVAGLLVAMATIGGLTGVSSAGAAGAVVDIEVTRGSYCTTLPSWAGVEVEAEFCAASHVINHVVQTPSGNVKVSNMWSDEITVTQLGTVVYRHAGSGHLQNLTADGVLRSVRVSVSDGTMSDPSQCLFTFEYRLKIVNNELVYEDVSFTCE